MGSILMLSFGEVYASTVRCGTEIVSTGDSIDQVLAKCGKPARREAWGPALRNNGVPKNGAVSEETLVYGPDGGAYRYFRFIEGELVEVRTERE